MCIELFLLSLAFIHYSSLFFSLPAAFCGAWMCRAARAFGEYLSQNHPEGRNGSGKSLQTYIVCICMCMHLFINRP